MAIYRRLVFGNLKSLLGSRFKVCKALLGEDAWNHTIRDFLIKHRATTPLFPELGREFLQYLQEHRDAGDQQLPFLLELAHYEWVESALRNDEADPDQIKLEPEPDLRDGVPVLSPLAWLLGYSWPVHRIRPEFIPTEKPPQPTWLMVYRNRKERISFMQLKPATARLCQLLQDNPEQSGHLILQQFAAEIGREDDEKVIQAGYEQLLSLQQKGIILGTLAAR